MTPRSLHRLVPIVMAYLPFPIAGAVLSVVMDVGASPEGGPGDMFLSGTALTPPLFLPAILVGAVLATRGGHRTRQVGAAVVSLVALAFLAGSTLNLPNDLTAAEAARSPVILSIALAIVHVAFALALLAHAAPAIVGHHDSSGAKATPA